MKITDIRLKNTGGCKWLRITNERRQFVRVPVSDEQIRTLLADILRTSPSLSSFALTADDETINTVKQIELLTNKLKAKLCRETSTL